MTARHSLDQIVRGLDGVTPGPWRTFNGTDVYPDDDDKEGMRHIADCDMEGSIGGDEQRANAAHIARCSPDTIREIAAYVRETEARATAAEATVTALQEALAKVEDAIFGRTLTVGSTEYFGVRELIRNALSQIRSEK